jgi:hypothetical protein
MLSRSFPNEAPEWDVDDQITSLRAVSKCELPQGLTAADALIRRR